MAKFALVFPGQGAQYPGMGQDLYRENRIVREVFAEAGEILGRDMAGLCFEGPQEVLDLTVNTQISILTTELATFRAFSERVAEKSLVMAGHSLGEYAALYAADAIGLHDVLPLVHLRALYHQEAVPVGEGAMAAIIGLSREAVDELCLEVDGEDHVVAFSIENAPGQIVISGHASAVAETIAAAGKKEGVRAVLLPISVPCHCRLLNDAAARFKTALARIQIQDCSIPVIPNCNPALLHSKERTAELLVRQITSPVRWWETVNRMAAMGVDTIVEIGPKRILSGLIRRIDRGLRLLNVEDGATLEKTVAALND